MDVIGEGIKRSCVEVSPFTCQTIMAGVVDFTKIEYRTLYHSSSLLGSL